MCWCIVELSQSMWIHAFSTISLYDLSADGIQKTASKLTSPSAGAGQLPPHQKIAWSDSKHKALNYLINILTNPPGMAYPTFGEPFILHMDASEQRLGAVLYQRQEGRLWVIGYSSRTLTPAEKKTISYTQVSLSF